MRSIPRYVALAGGVGAARFLRGLLMLVDGQDVTVVANTGDDLVLHGLHVSPDVDSLIYGLSGNHNPETGWGRKAESFTVLDELERLGGETWFRLGDRDLATHLFRTGQLAGGSSLSSVTARLSRAFGISARLLPMSDDPVRTKVMLSEGAEVDFQDYFVRLRQEPPISALRFEGAQGARPAPGVLEAVEQAEALLICPSNPLVSIAPIRAVPGIEEALRARRERSVAVSPIVAGSAIKGPAAQMLAELGMEPSVVGVARIYAPIASVLVLDSADADLASEVEKEGLRAVVTDTIMRSDEAAAALAAASIGAMLSQ